MAMLLPRSYANEDDNQPYQSSCSVRMSTRNKKLNKWALIATSPNHLILAVFWIRFRTSWSTLPHSREDAAVASPPRAGARPAPTMLRRSSIVGAGLAPALGGGCTFHLPD